MLRSTIFLVKGVNEFTRGGYQKASAGFDPAVMARDLRGRHCMVTGANQGLGFQTSVELARRGATLYMVCRNEERGKEAVERVREATGNDDVHVKARVGRQGTVCLAREMPVPLLCPSPRCARRSIPACLRLLHRPRTYLKVCDVSSLAAIRALAADYLSDPRRPLHLLVKRAAGEGGAEGGGGGWVNNAGVMIHQRQASPDGYEINFATNTLGSYALTRALEPALRRAAAAEAAAAAQQQQQQQEEEGGAAAAGSALADGGAAAAAAAAEAPASSGGVAPAPKSRPTVAAAVPVGARVVFVSSGGQYLEPLVVDDLQAEGMRKFDATRQYSRDKRRQVALAEALARRWGAEHAGILAVSMHPGWSDTEGVRTSIPGFHKVVWTFKNKLRDLEQGCETTVWLALEDANKLQPGGFYLDRKLQSKHLPLAGTRYSEADVDALVKRLEDMAAPALQ
eukprot:scaffold14.g1207.t1